MSRIFHPLLYMLACATRQELARQVQSLKEENRILRAKLSPATFRKWVNGEGKESEKKPAKKVGRPRRPQEIRDLVVRIATETGWGYTRILGELKKLGLRTIPGRWSRTS